MPKVPSPEREPPQPGELAGTIRGVRGRIVVIVVGSGEVVPQTCLRCDELVVTEERLDDRKAVLAGLVEASIRNPDEA